MEEPWNSDYNMESGELHNRVITLWDERRHNWWVKTVLLDIIGNTLVFIHCVCKDYIAAFVVVFALALFTPDKYNLNYFKFLYPFFTIGYLWEWKGVGEKLNKIFSVRTKIAWGGGYCLFYG